MNEMGDIVAFRACSRHLRSGALVVVERTDGNTTVARLDGLCPVHKTRDCIATYRAAGRLRRWTWTGWRAWRKAGGR